MKIELLRRYKRHFGQKLNLNQLTKLFARLERVSCKIAPLNTETGNTHTLNRWELPATDPHFASKVECRKIFTSLIEDLLGFLGVKEFKTRDFLKLYSDSPIVLGDLVKILNTTSRIGSLELPIWYKVPLKEEGKHVAENVYWFSPFTQLTELRELVGNKNIVTKVQVKSYLTDRRQTGDYQTNREVRWETHPKSPQYATRIDCTKIEAKLLAQIFTFVGAPALNKQQFIIEKALGIPYEKDSFRCPISGKPIFYNEFFEKVSSPIHGRSGYQVGHMNPLASTGSHIADNTSWITDLGNRVQGESSLEEITNNIFYMAAFHKKRLNLSWKDVDSIADQKQS